jgi:hypothetical protein
MAPAWLCHCRHAYVASLGCTILQTPHRANKLCTACRTNTSFLQALHTPVGVLPLLPPRAPQASQRAGTAQTAPAAQQRHAQQPGRMTASMKSGIQRQQGRIVCYRGSMQGCWVWHAQLSNSARNSKVVRLQDNSMRGRGIGQGCRVRQHPQLSH